MGWFNFLSKDGIPGYSWKFGEQKRDDYESYNIKGEVIQIKIILYCFENIILSIVLEKMQHFQGEYMPGVFLFQTGCDKIRIKNKVIFVYIVKPRLHKILFQLQREKGGEEKEEGRKKGEKEPYIISFCVLWNLSQFCKLLSLLWNPMMLNIVLFEMFSLLGRKFITKRYTWLSCIHTQP